jgi:hypothetical protein
MEGFLLLLCSALWPQIAFAQQSSNELRHVSPSSSVAVVERNGTCLYGPISTADANSLTIHVYGKAPVTIQRPEIIAVSQGDALLFTQANNWTNVQQSAAHVLPRETFKLRLKNGRTVAGKPVQANADSITAKHALGQSEYKRDAIATVDYLRWRPESDQFDYYSQEAPALLFFDPEFYSRAMGLEGRMSVRLFDAQKPITDPIPECPHK